MQGRPVDDEFSAASGAWEFNESVAEHFDSHVRKSLPLYDEIQKMIALLSDGYVTSGCKVYDLGTATGETIYRLQKRHQGLGVKFVGVENSEPMIERAKGKCDPSSVEFWLADVSDVESYPDAGLIIAMCTLQFVPVENRPRIISAIHKSLMPGGGFIWVEKLCIGSTALGDQWKTAYHDFKRRQGLTDEMIQQKEQSLEGVLIPITFQENVELLKQGGFSEIEPFFTWFNFCGFVARKGQ